MTSYYDILKELQTLYTADIDVNTVTTGEIEDIALEKQTMYSLAHIVVNSATAVNSTIQFNVTVFVMDKLEINKDNVTDIFKGNDNLHDVLNTTLATQIRVTEQLRRGAVTENSKLLLQGNPTLEPFPYRFIEGLSGWAATFDVSVAHTMTICD